MEAREVGAEAKAQQLIAEFRSSFKDIGFALHPGGIDGEAAGKSSNLAWAVRQAWNELKDEGDEERIARTIITVIDSDSTYFHAREQAKRKANFVSRTSRRLLLIDILQIRSSYTK